MSAYYLKVSQLHLFHFEFLYGMYIQHSACFRNAFAIALFLEQHEGVTRTLYPGLPSHPQHELAKQQQHGFGAMITFYCVGGKDQAAIFLQNVSQPLWRECPAYFSLL